MRMSLKVCSCTVRRSTQAYHTRFWKMLDSASEGSIDPASTSWFIWVYIFVRLA